MIKELDEDTKQRVRDALLQIQLFCLRTRCRECPLSDEKGYCLISRGVPELWKIDKYSDGKLLKR